VARTIREHLGNIQGIFREHFKEHSGNIQQSDQSEGNAPTHKASTGGEIMVLQKYDFPKTKTFFFGKVFGL
jgi:hypothetical protein